MKFKYDYGGFVYDIFLLRAGSAQSRPKMMDFRLNMVGFLLKNDRLSRKSELNPTLSSHFLLNIQESRGIYLVQVGVIFVGRAIAVAIFWDDPCRQNQTKFAFKTANVARKTAVIVPPREYFRLTKYSSKDREKSSPANRISEAFQRAKLAEIAVEIRGEIRGKSEGNCSGNCSGNQRERHTAADGCRDRREYRFEVPGDLYCDEFPKPAERHRDPSARNLTQPRKRPQIG